MLRPLTLIGTATALALAVISVNADDSSSCPACDNSGSPYSATGWTETPGIIYDNCDQCDSSGGRGCSLCSSKGWPDKGWNPPAQYPVNRDGIWYRNMWPQAWYGNPGGGFIANSPMVYQPTDTTQLGYSYAKVPTWQSIRMIPPTPCPANFHARVCVPRPHPGRLIDGCPSGNPCHSPAEYGHGGFGSGSSCPSCQQGHAANGDVGQPQVGTEAPANAVQPRGDTPTQAPNLAMPPQEYQQVSFEDQDAPGLFNMATLRNPVN